MVRPDGESSRRETAEAARVRRLEDAFIAFANNANQAGGQPQQQKPHQQTIFDRFARHRPPTYDGLCDPVVLEAWIREMEKLFMATLCPEYQKVGIATYYLQREADNWWSISRAMIQAQPGFGWALFCEALKKRFYPDELRWQKEREFLQLEQRNLSVQAYADKFMELSRFATTIIPDEAARVRRFEKNLTPKVRTVLAGSPSMTFQQAYDRALSVYESVKAEEAETPYHAGKTCDGALIVCFTCNEPGHKSFNCPQRPASTVKGSGSGSGSGSQTQNGRIFVMTQAEVESHPDINTGIFLSSLIPMFIHFVLSTVFLSE
ncbi:hypothetical protein RND81_09G083600 [Saponaria officinalis]|uniref:CCHC-type domain-containing protein n=1 Tax=Saponaria officinalis TaxID=3572 RepID=A0AAW1IK72_SAPOF